MIILLQKMIPIRANSYNNHHNWDHLDFITVNRSGKRLSLMEFLLHRPYRCRPYPRSVRTDSRGSTWRRAKTRNCRRSCAPKGSTKQMERANVSLSIPKDWSKSSVHSSSTSSITMQMRMKDMAMETMKVKAVKETTLASACHSSKCQALLSSKTRTLLRSTRSCKRRKTTYSLRGDTNPSNTAGSRSWALQTN